MDTSALSSEMAMGRRPIAKSGLFSLVSIKEVHLQGGTFLDFGGALFRSSLWFTGMWVPDVTYESAVCAERRV
jgi:hypothetical protein